MSETNVKKSDDIIVYYILGGLVMKGREKKWSSKEIPQAA